MVTTTLIGGAIINLYIHIFGLSSQVNQVDKYSSYLQWELWEKKIEYHRFKMTPWKIFILNQSFVLGFCCVW